MRGGFIAVSLVLSLILGGIGLIDYSCSGLEAGNQSENLITHVPIRIDGNDDFVSQAESEGWQGDGTQNNPYIIENYDINASSADGIYIKNTDVYFVIKNCRICDGRRNCNSGVEFYNVTNGEIEKVTSYNNYWGIFLSFSSDNTLTGCVVYYGQLGVRLSKSSNNQILGTSSHTNTGSGISLWDSLNNQIINCSSYGNGNGVFICSEKAVSMYNNVMLSNIVNNDHGVYIIRSSDNNVTKSLITNNNIGIDVEDSSGTTINYCDIYDNRYGVRNSNSQEEYRVNAMYNWWGSANGPSDAGPGKGDKVSDCVDYDPWLTQPVKISEEKPEDSILKIFYLPLVGVVSAVILVIIVVMVRRRKNKKVKGETKEVTLGEAGAITVKCPYCDTTFHIIPTTKPFKAKCPKCGKVSLLR